MCKNLNEYLKKLKKELSGCDKALIQDAVSDAEEYLTTSLETIRRNNQDLGEEESFKMAEADFGSPDEIAQDYKKYESYSSFRQSKETESSKKPWWLFLKIFADIRAWGAILYMTISLLTGIIFFTWVAAGLSFSLSLLILIIGIPFAGLYLLSIRGLALLEGRIVEALLGVRMPRRGVFISNEKGLWSKFKELICSGITWKVQIYMILQLGFGILYFTLTWVLFAWSIGMISVPIVYLFMPENVMADINPEWLKTLLPLFPFVGFFLMAGFLHLAKLIGRFHGWFAKLMLVHI
ncbi:MAG: sensor domain-containing protein [Candidatus Cloacimonetes bacterium]|nr:sensor domain-containing protein [Candidatus Cloacimonadota bacterium]